MKVLVLGANGFIGHSLIGRILADTDWEVYGMDLAQDRICHHFGNSRFHFTLGDITACRDWVELHVRRCNVVLPLAAVATPIDYVRDPLHVFSLDFEENLHIIRACVRHHSRVIFPSTSEVYGMCPDELFDEEASSLVLGPIGKQRWIYSCSKQLLDRILWAYGEEGLSFTIFRPFNWFGPNLDDFRRPEPGSSRVVSQFLGALMRGEPLQLVGGGEQRRAFTYIDDGVDALLRILRNEGGRAEGRIFNIGNPGNDYSIRELAEVMVEVLAELPGFAHLRDTAALEDISGADYYGDSYQDLNHRRPDITRARTLLGWEPQISLREGLRRVIAFHLDAGQEPAMRKSAAG